MSSLLGELDAEPGADTRSISLDELRKMRRRGELNRARSGGEEMELDETFWAHAKLMPPLFPPEQAARAKTSVHMRLDADVFEWFKAQGKGHLTRMNAVLRAYFEANRKDRG